MQYLELVNNTHIDISNNKLNVIEIVCSQSSKMIMKELKKAKNKDVVLDITINNSSSKENLIKNLTKLYKRLCRCNVKIGIQNDNKTIIAKISDYADNEEKYKDIITAINAIQFTEKEQKYNYLYDKICEYLDNEFITKSICCFKNDKCKVKANTNVTMGCCYHNGNKYFGILYGSKLRLCEYLVDKRCSAQCITCKLFTCDELRKTGIKYTTNNIPLIKYFFNPIQKFIIISSHFTPKEKILKRIIKWSL